MSWMAQLYQTYENCVDMDLPIEQRVMPICHTPQQVHIHVSIDDQANFISAEVLEKFSVVLPATESSASRSSGVAPHALADKLQYVAADFEHYSTGRKPFFSAYSQQLAAWCESEYAHPKVQLIYRYLTANNLIADLIKHGVCWVDENNKFLEAWDQDATDRDTVPPIFKVLTKTQGVIDQGNALVCWSVLLPGDLQNKTWEDESIRESWIRFDLSNAGESKFCYITGANKPAGKNHPAKIRYGSDKAKLISSNDNSGFTYRGRFVDPQQAATVSFEVSQKAHNALRWLIDRQGSKGRNGEQVVLAWSTTGVPVPNPIVDPAEWGDELSPNGAEVSVADSEIPDYGRNFAFYPAQALKRKIQGFAEQLHINDSINILVLDSATPGRMAVSVYLNFLRDDYFESLENWQTHFCWWQRLSAEKQDKNRRLYYQRWRVEAPSIWKIAEATFGDAVKNNDKLKRAVVERLLPSILLNRNIPDDIYQRCIQRACQRSGKEPWEWEQDLGVACALFSGFHHPDRQIKPERQRTYTMALDTNYTSRAYLYGRLLAVGELIETWSNEAMRIPARTTHVSRLFQRFSDRPATTWLTIEKHLAPYRQRLKTRSWPNSKALEGTLDQILSLFDTTDFNSDAKLSGEFLLGYHCQRLALDEERAERRAKAKADKNIDTEDEEISTEGDAA